MPSNLVIGGRQATHSCRGNPGLHQVQRTTHPISKALGVCHKTRHHHKTSLDPTHLNYVAQNALKLLPLVCAWLTGMGYPALQQPIF